MQKYTDKERLPLDKRVYITEKAKDLLKELKEEKGISMGKIVSNLIIEEHEKTK